MCCQECGVQFALNQIYHKSKYGEKFCTLNCAYRSMKLERQINGPDPRQGNLNLGEKDAAV